MRALASESHRPRIHPLDNENLAVNTGRTTGSTTGANTGERCDDGRGARPGRASGQGPAIYPLDNEILSAKASLLSLLSLSLSKKTHFILLNSKNVYNRFKDS